jgi:hypothetical protein
MTTRRAPHAWAVVLMLVCGTFVCSTAASAQTATPPGQTPPPIQGTTTTVETTTIAGTLSQIVGPAGTSHLGDALGLAAQLGMATTPYGAASGGFLIKLDPSTGLEVRTATTFGPAFAERALTSGEGKLSLGVSIQASTYDRLDNIAVDNNMQLLSSTAATPAASRSGTANLSIKSTSTVAFARMGVTDNFDIGVNVPIVAVKFSGTASLKSGVGDVLFAQGAANNGGLGDVQGIAKYRFHSFGTGQPDPGGLAAMVTMTLPTGDREQLRGLGVTRTLVSLIASSGQARLRPHGNVGFGYWSKGVSVVSDTIGNPTVTARNEFNYAAGVEFEAVPKLTLLLDLLGGGVLGGGAVGFASVTPIAGTTASQALLALPNGTRRIDLAPGLKANIKGKMLISLNALVALHDTGLHARVTPVAGIDLTF